MSSPDQSAEKKDVTAEVAAPDAPEAQAAESKVEKEEAGDTAAEAKDSETTSDTKPAESADTEMKDAPEESPAAATAEANDAGDAKAKAARRKSTGASASGAKKLNKKQSKARLLNLNAQPGDHYLVKLKGFPPWPAVICDEVMLPQQLLDTRPVTAKRPDGTYREDFADGGRRVADRTFPVMYLYTNEFGWVPNTSLQELSPEQATAAINDKMRKDLQAAYELAAEGNDLDHYKDVLQKFQEELVAKEQAKEQAKKAKKAKASKVDEMDIDDVDDATPAKKSKKRKAEEEVATPQRSDSVKKPKIKLMSSAAKAAAANGAGTPKAKDQSAAKSKSKAKKSAEADTPVQKKPDLTPEERHQRRVKEVLYLRHKLQKGFFTKDQEPKEEEMSLMSDFFTRLEAFTEMDATILRETRIHKVPKAIIRLESIPKEAEFNFKKRSQGLLDQWNKLLAAEAPAAKEGKGSSNGVNGAKEAKDQPKEKAEAEEGGDKKTEVEKPTTGESSGKEAAEEKTETPAAEGAKAAEAVEATA